MVVGIVKIALGALRCVAELGFFLEAQRFLLRFVRPTSSKALSRIEDSLLAVPASRIRRRWVKAKSHTLHTLIVGDERNPKIVVLHGHSMSAAFYFRNFDDLVSLGFCVYAVDLLGWGRSDRPQFSGSTAEESLDWYLSSLNACFKSLKLDKFVLCGHSLGGYISLEYAKKFPAQVSRLMLISPAACARSIPFKRAVYFSLPPQSVIRRGGLLGFLIFMIHYPRSVMYITDRLREYTYQLAAQGPPSGEVAITPMIKFDGFGKASCVRPLIENVVKLPMPVRVVCGETDSSMRVEDIHDLYKALKKSGCAVRLSIVKGADHCPHLEKPKEFFKVVSEFCTFKT